MSNLAVSKENSPNLTGCKSLATLIAVTITENLLMISSSISRISADTA